MAISVDSPEVSRDLCKKAGYTFPVLSDPKAEVIRHYDLLHTGGGPNSSDISRPAEFLVDKVPGLDSKSNINRVPLYNLSIGPIGIDAWLFAERFG